MLVYLGDIAGAGIMESDGRSACQPIMTRLFSRATLGSRAVTVHPIPFAWM